MICIDCGVCKLSSPRPVTSLFSFELQAESHRIALSCVALFFSFIGTWHVRVQEYIQYIYIMCA